MKATVRRKAKNPIRQRTGAGAGALAPVATMARSVRARRMLRTFIPLSPRSVGKCSWLGT